MSATRRLAIHGVSPQQRRSILAALAECERGNARKVQKRLLLVGDGGAACHEYGQVLGVCAEVPLPRVSVTSREYSLEGVGGISSMLRQWGVRSVVAHPVGDGTVSALQKRLLAQYSVSALPLDTGASQRTSITKRIFAGGHQLAHTEEEELIPPASDGRVTQTVKVLERHLVQCGMMIILDHEGAGLSEEFSRRLVALAHAASVPVFYEPRSARLPISAALNTIKVNQNQIRQWFGSGSDSDRDACMAAGKALQYTKARNVVFTRGRKGILVRSKRARSDETYLIAPEPRRLYDLVSAGDVVTAALSFCMARRYTLLQSACFAATAAELSLDRRHEKRIDLWSIFNYHAKWKSP